MKQVTKTISMLSLAFLVVITTAFAGTNTVKPESKTELFSRFGNINNVTWIQSDHYSKASFVSDGEQVNAFFENDGSCIGSSRNVKDIRNAKTTTTNRGFTLGPHNRGDTYTNDGLKSVK